MSIWELAHDWAEHSVRSEWPWCPHSQPAQDTPVVRSSPGPGTRHSAPLHPSLGWARALRSPKPCYNFPRAGPVIGKYCHPPLNFNSTFNHTLFKVLKFNFKKLSFFHGYRSSKPGRIVRKTASFYIYYTYYVIFSESAFGEKCILPP